MSLILDNIDVGYKDKTIVKSLSLEVKKGESLGIAGINGAGKSTTLKSIAGLIPITQGKISLNGFHPITALDKEIFKSQIGYCPDVGGIIPSATPKEHINLLINLNRDNKDKAKVQEAYELLEKVDLTKHLNSPCGGFSHGMLRRMSVALASFNATELLILDEPFDGVDPTGVQAIQDIIKSHTDRGHIVITSSHLINVLAETTDRLMVMVGGKIVSHSPSKKFEGYFGTKRYRKLLGITK